MALAEVSERIALAQAMMRRRWLRARWALSAPLLSSEGVWPLA